MKVNFLIIGAARSATTSLSSILANHPSISFSNPKEPQFFSKEDWRDRIAKYHKLFNKKDGVLYGEGSTNYTKFPSFNKTIYNDIYEYNPEMKLIYIVRKPLDRMRSHYKFAVERGYTTESINTALQTNSIYTDVSKYHMQITPYINTFGFKNVKIIFFEDFVSDTEKAMSDICDFLNISSDKLNFKKTHFNQSTKGKIGSIKYDNPKSLQDYFKKTINFIKRRFSNSNSSNVEMEELSEATITKIQTVINSDLEKFEKLTKRNLSNWKI